MKMIEKVLKKLQESGFYQKPWFQFDYEILDSDGEILGIGDDAESALKDYNKSREWQGLTTLSKRDLKRYQHRWVCFLYDGEDPSIDEDHDSGETQNEALKNLMSHIHA